MNHGQPRSVDGCRADDEVGGEPHRGWPFYGRMRLGSLHTRLIIIVAGGRPRPRPPHSNSRPSWLNYYHEDETVRGLSREGLDTLYVNTA